jgi:hypothetical protein
MEDANMSQNAEQAAIDNMQTAQSASTKRAVSADAFRALSMRLGGTPPAPAAMPAPAVATAPVTPPPVIPAVQPAPEPAFQPVSSPEIPAVVPQQTPTPSTPAPAVAQPQFVPPVETVPQPQMQPEISQQEQSIATVNPAQQLTADPASAGLQFTPVAPTPPAPAPRQVIVDDQMLVSPEPVGQVAADQPVAPQVVMPDVEQPAAPVVTEQVTIPAFEPAPQVPQQTPDVQPLVETAMPEVRISPETVVPEAVIPEAVMPERVAENTSVSETPVPPTTVINVNGGIPVIDQPINELPPLQPDEMSPVEVAPQTTLEAMPGDAMPDVAPQTVLETPVVSETAAPPPSAQEVAPEITEPIHSAPAQPVVFENVAQPEAVAPIQPEIPQAQPEETHLHPVEHEPVITEPDAATQPPQDEQTIVAAESADVSVDMVDKAQPEIAGQIREPIEAPEIEVPEIEVPDIEMPDIEMPDMSMTKSVELVDEFSQPVTDTVEAGDDNSLNPLLAAMQLMEAAGLKSQDDEASENGAQTASTGRPEALVGEASRPIQNPVAAKHSDTDKTTGSGSADSPSLAKRRPDLELEPDEESGRTARKLLDMMSASGSAQPQERALAADTLLQLVPRMPVRDLVALSERVCMMEDAPALLVDKLINHSKARVAQPLLEGGTVISEQDMLKLITTCDVDRLIMIAKRREVSSTVCDALCARGQASVYLTLVRNPGAKLSHDAFVTLCEIAKTQAALQAPLATRGDTPPPIAFELFWSLPVELRRYILSRFLTDSGTLDKILKIAQSVDGGKAGEKSSEPSFPPRRKTESMVELIVEGAGDEAAAMMADLAGVGIENARRIIADPDGEPLTVALKTLGLTRNQFHTDISKCVNSPQAMLRADRNVGELQAMFDSLSFNKARTLITYWDWAMEKTGPYTRRVM